MAAFTDVNTATTLLQNDKAMRGNAGGAELREDYNEDIHRL
jgi:hypothetical protein